MLYLDTGCLVKLYYPEPESITVAKIVFGKGIIFTELHELEMATAMQLKDCCFGLVAGDPSRPTSKIPDGPGWVSFLAALLV